MFCIEAGFPAGRYYAAAPEDLTRPEWPPHPSRLFSALLAASRAPGSPVPLPDADRALRWLENCAPPALYAPPADLHPSPAVFVPPADRSSKKEDREHPVHRARKERRFPCAWILGEPRVLFLWAETPEEETRAILDRLCAQVTHVGTSHSMAVLKVAQPSRAANWLPDPGGRQLLRVPVQGRCQELLELHERLNDRKRGGAGIRRPTPMAEAFSAYRHASRQLLPQSLEFRSFHILRLLGATHDARDGRTLARALRRAVMALVGEPIPEAIHGHGKRAHAAWLPLPHVRWNPGGQPSHSRGRILGLAVAVPRDMEEGEELRLLDALAELSENGLRTADGRSFDLEPVYAGVPVPRTLRPSTWTGPARTWMSVTPVVPDRLPSRPSAARVRNALLDAVKRRGLPEPEILDPLLDSPLEGAVPARSWRHELPRHHLRLRFPQSVAGPLLLGRERYFGGGLLFPLPHLDTVDLSDGLL